MSDIKKILADLNEQIRAKRPASTNKPAPKHAATNMKATIEALKKRLADVTKQCRAFEG
jgi:hypothetical protein